MPAGPKQAKPEGARKEREAAGRASSPQRGAARYEAW
jgi:hypothetical protein